MKVLHVHLRSGQSLRRILKEEQLSGLLETVERGMKSGRRRPILAAEDVQGNPFVLRLDEVNALHIDDFDIDDL